MLAEYTKIGDRFYLAQLRETGRTVGILTKKRGRKMAWSEDKKAEAVAMYIRAEATPENSMEIVKEIAEELEESPNGVRMILTKAGCYVKKASGSETSAAPKEGSTKVSKAAAFEQLNAAIKAVGLEPDASIIEKLTGKAALYFASVLASKAV